MTWASLVMIVAGLGLSWPLTAWSRALGRKWGQMDAPGHRKIHTVPIPATGGIAIFWAVMIPLAAGLGLLWGESSQWWEEWFAQAAVHLEGARSVTGMALALMGAAALLHGVGLIDDRRNLGPGVKLVAQVVAAGVLVIFFNVRLMEWWGGAASIVLTILWFVVITNAFNFLDNMDGLSAGVATICAGILLTIALLGGQWFVAALLGLLIGAMLGFLMFNFPPASIFMGDGGSLVIGFLVAFCSVRVTYYDSQSVVQGPWWAVFTPLIVLAIPLYDLTSVTLIRLSQGKSPFVGDTQHFSHRLVRKGLGRTGAVIVIYACTIAAGMGGIMLGRLTEAWQAVLVLVQTVSILVVLALLERTAIKESQE